MADSWLSEVVTSVCVGVMVGTSSAWYCSRNAKKEDRLDLRGDLQLDSGRMADKTDALRKMLREVLAPLLRADGGELYLVSVNKKELKLHLAGKLSGSPGTPVTADKIIAPAVRAFNNKLKLVITSGWSVPKGAERIEPAK
jgi:Fe-S cluster biogenesis protein NfuA